MRWEKTSRKREHLHCLWKDIEHRDKIMKKDATDKKEIGIPKGMRREKNEFHILNMGLCPVGAGVADNC